MFTQCQAAWVVVEQYNLMGAKQIVIAFM